jgi:hypothetical protein
LLIGDPWIDDYGGGWKQGGKCFAVEAFAEFHRKKNVALSQTPLCYIHIKDKLTLYFLLLCWKHR